MSFAYPVYENKDSDDIWFYFCSSRKTNTSVEFKVGSILNDNAQVLFEPKYSVVDKPNDTHTVKKELMDCTVINLYYIDGKWHYGTKNSWNIDRLRDITNVTYGEYFRESLSHYPDFSFDKLDTKKMYTVLFSNPKCHFFSSNYRVCVHDESDDLASVLEVLPETDNENHILLSREENTIYIHQTDIHKRVTDCIYRNRKKCKDEIHSIAVAKCIISALCYSEGTSNKQQQRLENREALIEYLLKTLNEDYQNILSDVLQVGIDFQNANQVIDSYLGVRIPIDILNTEHDGNFYSPKNIGFYISIYKQFIKL